MAKFKVIDGWINADGPQEIGSTVDLPCGNPVEQVEADKLVERGILERVSEDEDKSQQTKKETATKADSK
jgi:hypothetical protein